MAVKKKSLATETSTKKEASKASEARRLDQGEMRKLERLSADIAQARTRMQLQEQVLVNTTLKIENLKMMMKELERESLLVKERIRSEHDEMTTKSKNLEAFANELKEKYQLQGEELRYDMLSGQIQK